MFYFSIQVNQRGTTYDAVVVGSGPNGLAAAITLQQAGLAVLLLEGKEEIGGGMRSEELTLPGFVHDVCSAIHPMALASPFFTSVPLGDHGLRFVQPDLAAAHPLDGGRGAALFHSVAETARQLGADEKIYQELMEPVVQDWPFIVSDVLAPFHFPKHPLRMLRFGIDAITSAMHLSKRFKTAEARGLWAGMAAHAIQPLTNLATSAVGMVLMAQGHLKGWPIPVGGSASIAKALASYFISLGGTIETGQFVRSLKELPSSSAVLLDLTPKQLLEMAGDRFSPVYNWQLSRFRYGMGVFKIDWALKEPIPFQHDLCRRAGTVHLGGTLEEIAAGEDAAWNGQHPDRPYVLLAQQTLFDPTRAPEGKHTAWAYCHVPNGSQVDMTTIIEKQVERFAPGFQDTILARHTKNSVQMQQHNPNYIGGDINGGVIDIRQLFTRPALRWSPYRTSAKGIYLCSSSTPPGGGVHGMCGYHAARQALKDIFNIEVARL